MNCDITDISNFLLENYQQEYATAVQNAWGQVNSYESGCTQRRQKFNKKINSALCEALIYLNTIPHCPKKYISSMRTLINGYRKVNNLPYDDYYYNW